MVVIYGSSLSPFARKAIVFAAEKGIPAEVRAPARDGSDPDFTKASPFGKMPALKDGDFAVSDSTAIVTYLDALKPEPNLIPTEAKARARAIWFDEFADTIVWDTVGKIYFNRIIGPRFLGLQTDLAVADEMQKSAFPKIVDYLESVIPASGFLVEDRLTLADIAVASPLACLAHADCAVQSGSHPKTSAYLQAILARPAFAQVLEKEKAMLAA